MIHPNESVGYFESVSSGYADLYLTPNPGGYAFRVRKAKLLNLIGFGNGRVLDVGCGPGIMAQDLVDRGFEFWGLDASPGMVELGVRTLGKHPRVHFLVGDAANIGLADNSFDLVLCAGVIDRIPNYERAIQEMIRVLKPGGMLLVAFPNACSLYSAWRRYVYNPLLDCVKTLLPNIAAKNFLPVLRGRVTLHHESRARQLVERNGTICASPIHFNFNLFLSPLDELFPAATIKLAETLEARDLGLSKWLGTAFILHALKAEGKRE
ncbi:MAG: class I SAM-dependent methyltransferase [Acidobacteriota bacterium]|nr:class I SAM-dependent methyltransferase [Acidobacteriota bacterium]